MPQLHSRPLQRLFLNVRLFRVSCTTLPWSYLLRLCSLHSATFVLWVILLPAVANSFCDPQLPSVRIFPEDVSLVPCHCCTTRHFLAGGSQHPPRSQFPRVSSSGFLRRLAARFQSLCCLLCCVFPVYTAACSLETSQCCFIFHGH
jgi:hypothetical protein